MVGGEILVFHDTGNSDFSVYKWNMAMPVYGMGRMESSTRDGPRVWVSVSFKQSATPQSRLQGRWTFPHLLGIVSFCRGEGPLGPCCQELPVEIREQESVASALQLRRAPHSHSWSAPRLCPSEGLLSMTVMSFHACLYSYVETLKVWVRSTV